MVPFFSGFRSDKVAAVGLTAFSIVGCDISI